MSAGEDKNKTIEEQSVQIIQSVNKKNVLSSNQKLQNPKDQWQVIEPNSNKWSITASQEDFKKLYESLSKNKEKQMKIKADDLHKSKLKKKKADQKKQIEKESQNKQEAQRLKILKMQQPIVQNFKATHIHTMGGSELSSLRSQLKLNTFKYLLYGIHEMKQIDPTTLDPSDKMICNLKDPYSIARNLTIEIDIKLFKYMNYASQKNIDKKYRSFVKCFIKNIGQESNKTLRRRILTRKTTPSDLYSLNQQDLYPPEIQQKLIERKNYLIRQSTVLPKQSSALNQQPSIVGEQGQNFEGRSLPKIQTLPMNQNTKKQSNIYKEFKQTLQILNTMLSHEQLSALKSNLDIITQPKVHKKLQDHIDFIFAPHKKQQ